MGEGRGSFVAWVERNKEKHIAEGVIPKPEDVFQSIYSYTKPGISIVPEPRCEKEIWDESKQGDRTELIREYLQAVEEVRKNKKLPPKEKLNKLLTPLMKLCDITFPPGYESNLKFITEDITLKEELDIENLINNSKKYAIVEDTELKELGILCIDNKNIWLSERYTDYLSYCEQVELISEAEFAKIPYEKEYREQDRQNLSNGAEVMIELGSGLFSVSEIYTRWLPTLTQEKMKSNDLLDRILVTYTIKRALNRDGKAIDKLCGLFQNVAEGIAVKMAVKRRLKKHIDDIRADAMAFLRLIIGGFSPKVILDGLNQTSNFKIPKSVETFYIYWLSEEVSKRLTGILQKRLFDPFGVLVLLNPISPINAETRWRTTPKATRMFNSFSFRPNKKTNLYTWLFGVMKDTKGKSITSGHMQGRFCQLQSEELDRYYKLDKEIAVKNLDESEGCKTYNKSLSRSAKHKTTQEFDLEELEAVLLKRGIQERNVEILILKQKKHSYAEISKLCNISRRQAIRIYQKYKPLLGKLVAEDIEE